MTRTAAMMVLIGMISAPRLDAAEPKAIFVLVPPLKTDSAKAATEIQRMFKRKPKEFSVLESATGADYTIEVLSVTKRNVGELHNAIVPGQTDAIQATVVTAKLCVPAKAFCDTIEDDSGDRAVQIGALEAAARDVYEKVVKAIK